MILKTMTHGLKWAKNDTKEEGIKVAQDSCLRYPSPANPPPHT